MTHNYRLRGFGPKETLLALIVLVVVAAILIPIGLRQNNASLLLDESRRMRNVFRALLLYEDQYDSQPAASLSLAQIYDSDHADYVSSRDPFAATKAAGTQVYPSDPGLDNNETSPFRISFSYIENFARAGKIKIKSWAETRLDSNVGEISNEWLGSVQPGDNFHAQVAGKILRICTDGHVFILPDRGGPKPLGDAQDLFIKR